MPLGTSIFLIASARSFATPSPRRCLGHLDHDGRLDPDDRRHRRARSVAVLHDRLGSPARGARGPRGRTRHLPRAAGPLARESPGAGLARRYAQPVSDPTASAGLLIDAARLADWMAAEPGLQVIDVREPHEREAGHIAEHAAHRAEPPHRRGGEHRPRPSRHLLLPRRRTLRNGGRSLPRRRLRGILPGRGPGALGRSGPAALARGRHCGRPLERRPRWRLRPTSRKSGAATAGPPGTSTTWATVRAFARSARVSA